MIRFVLFAATLLFGIPAMACESLRFAATNDTFGLGMGPARDDFRSFGSRAEARCAKLGVDLEYVGFTNRNYVDPSAGSRVDEVSLLASWAVVDHPRAKFAPVVGVLTRGDFAGDDIQNTWHNISGHPEVHLPYERGRTSVALGMRTEVLLSASRYAELSAYASSWLAPRYGAHAEGFLELRLGRDNFWVAPSVGWRDGFRTNSAALTASLAEEDGIFVRLEHEISFLWFRAETALDTDYVGGALGVDIAHKPQRAFSRADLGVEFGTMVTPQESLFIRYRSISSFFRRRLGTTLEVAWGPYVEDRVRAFPRVRAHYFEALIGNEFSAFTPKPKLQLNPYGRLSAGVRHEAIYGAESVYSHVTRNQAVLAPEVGVRLTMPIAAWDEGVLYGLTAFYRPTLVGPDSTIDVLGSPQPLGRSRHTIGVGLTFIGDL